MVVQMKCEGEWNSIHYFPSVTFVVLTLINLLGTMMAGLNNRRRIAMFVEKIAHFPRNGILDM